jgi:hypothetical protein
MKINTLPNLVCGLLLCISLISCNKDNLFNQNNGSCTKLAQLHAHPFTAVEKGGQIDLSADFLQDAYYAWFGPGNYQSYGQNNTISTSASYGDEGWYFLRISYDGCDDRIDSVYVDVKFPQGTAPCSPTDNSAGFGGPLLLGDQAFYFIDFGSSTVGADFGITGNSSNGDISITMSGYWLTHDFEDGIYYTTSNQVFEYADRDKVFISDVNQNIYWVAEPDKPVYISHVGGKRRITFCNIQFSGDYGGNLYHTNVDAQITEP